MFFVHSLKSNGNLIKLTVTTKRIISHYKSLMVALSVNLSVNIKHVLLFIFQEILFVQNYKSLCHLELFLQSEDGSMRATGLFSTQKSFFILFLLRY